MANREYSTLRRPDAEVLRAFSEIDSALGYNGGAGVSVVIVQGLQSSLSSTVNSLSTTPGFVELMTNGSSYSSQLRFIAPGKQFQIHVHRELNEDKVSIHIQDNSDAITAARQLSVVSQFLPGFGSTDTTRKILGSQLQEFYDRREATLLRLEELSQKLIDQNEEYRRTLDLEKLEGLKKLESSKEEFLNATRAEYEEKTKELKARMEEIDARSKDLDDRANRHVRRQIRKELLEKLASREKVFQLSKLTNSKRLPIHVQFWALLLLSIVILYIGITSTIQAPNEILSIAKLSVGFIGFAATSVYYIRWTNGWFRQHSDEEFRLQRLALDFDRASWVVEMALEWKQEKGEEIPQELIQRLTANLFTSSEASEPLRHPVEDLAAALVGASANVKLNLPGGTELNLDRKGIKTLGQ